MCDHDPGIRKGQRGHYFRRSSISRSSRFPLRNCPGRNGGKIKGPRQTGALSLTGLCGGLHGGAVGKSQMTASVECVWWMDPAHADVLLIVGRGERVDRPPCGGGGWASEGRGWENRTLPIQRMTSTATVDSNPTRIPQANLQALLHPA